MVEDRSKTHWWLLERELQPPSALSHRLCGPASGWPCSQLSMPVRNVNLHKEGLVCWSGSKEIST